MTVATALLLPLLLVQSSPAQTRTTEERVFAVESSFDRACQAVISSDTIRKLIYQHDPEYVGFERFCRRGYAVCQARIPRISVVVDVVLTIEIWRGEEQVTFRIRASGTLPASSGRIVRAIVLRSARRRFATELDSLEDVIRLEVARDGGA